MIRAVHFRKAILGGAAGAAAWEFVVRLLILAGLPLPDIVCLLGTMAFPNSSPLLWWPMGMTIHASVGAIWAIFYAYFFWSVFDWPPQVQGLVFSLLPATLALLIMLPQIVLMHPLLLGGGSLPALPQGWTKPLGVYAAHLIYGAVIGSLYTHPVGARVALRKVAHG
jgi:hypothetical protein